VIEDLPLESRKIIRALSPNELGELRLYWGAMLARHFALYRGNREMLESCGGSASTAGSAIVQLITEELALTELGGQR
jgi:hypothetical protein